MKSVIHGNVNISLLFTSPEYYLDERDFRLIFPFLKWEFGARLFDLYPSTIPCVTSGWSLTQVSNFTGLSSLPGHSFMWYHWLIIGKFCSLIMRPLSRCQIKRHHTVSIRHRSKLIWEGESCDVIKNIVDIMWPYISCICCLLRCRLFEHRVH